jgi:Protein of unknown function (DUF1236)
LEGNLAEEVSIVKVTWFVMSATAAALIAGSGATFAQQEQHGGSAGKMAPASNAQSVGPAGHEQPGRVGTQNSAGANGRGNAAEEQRGGNQPNRVGQEQRRGGSTTTGQAPHNERRDSGRAEPNRAPNEQNRGAEQRGNGRNPDRDLTTGQGAAPSKGPNAGLSANVTPETRTQIHDVFIKERGAPRVEHVDFALSVGTAVPRSVHIVQVPREIVEIEPRWRGYDYFMVGDQVVIVDPRSMEIVAVLDV